MSGGKNTISSKQDNITNIPSKNSNNEILNGGDFTSELSIATLNVNSLFKAENIEHTVFKRKTLRNEKKITLKREIISQQILNGNNISILTDTRLNISDVRDLQEQLSVTHKVYSTANKYKRAGITIIIENKISLKIDFTTNLTMEDGPRVLVISGTLPNKKRITISGVYIAPNS